MSLNAVNVHKTLGGAAVLTDVSLSVQKGRIHALVGENGAGKTTLLRVLAGLYKPEQGEARADGLPVFNNPEAKARIAFMPAQCELFPMMRKEALLRFYKSMYPSFDAKRFESLTQGLDLGKKPVRRLSTGMKMQLSIALALARNPEILLLDEPFAALDVVVKRRIMQLLTEQTDAAILISSHSLMDLERISDDVTFLIKGRVTLSGDVFDVKSSAFKRLQVVFERDVPEDLLAWEGVTDMQILGRVITLTYEGDDEKMEARLRDAGVMLLERLGSTLEDAFIHGYERALKKGEK